MKRKWFRIVFELQGSNRVAYINAISRETAVSKLEMYKGSSIQVDRVKPVDAETSLWLHKRSIGLTEEAEE